MSLGQRRIDPASLIGVKRVGRLVEVAGTVLRATVPDVHLGELCRVEQPGARPLLAEVVGFNRQEVILMPLGPMTSIVAGARIEPAGEVPSVPCGEAVRGRVLDALGAPLDDGPPLDDAERAPLFSPPPSPLARARITEPLQTGVRAIDGLLTVGRGQRVGLFAAAGGGKSTLLSMLARNVDADRVVVALIGERGREVRGFLEDALRDEGRAKATVVVSTSDQPALLRLRAAYVATAIAEEARSRGERVVLLMDSVTRFARALRDVGLAAGEPPGRQGFPGSVFAQLPVLFERTGNDGRGSITAFYTVLVAGDDLEEPIADETISLLDGHVLLSRRLAERGQYPAIDILNSKSRLMNEIVGDEHKEAAARMRRALALYDRNYDKIQMGRFDPPTEEEAELAELGARVGEFLGQGELEAPTLDETVDALRRRVGL